MTIICDLCGLPDPYAGCGDGMSTCDCPRCYCGAAEGSAMCICPPEDEPYCDEPPYTDAIDDEDGMSEM